MSITSSKPEEQTRIQVAARQYADQTHLVNNTVSVGEVAVPVTEPYWDCQPGQSSRQRWDMMVLCLLQGMEIVSEKVVNFDKLWEITQLADETLAIF